MWEKISPSIADLANGKFKGKNFEAESFGVKPFDKTIKMVIDQAMHEKNLSFSNDSERTKFEKKVLEKILTPAMTKYLGIMKFLVALPGNPTIFAGDDMGATGYETKTKNIFLQNRNYLHHEWLDPEDDEYREFIANKKNDLDNLLAFRKRPELHALNDGAPYTLNLMDGKEDYSSKHKQIAGLLRLSTDGAMALSLFNTAGIHNNFDENYKANGVTIDKIDLNESSANKQAGLPKGLKPGLIFANAYNDNDKYTVIEENGKYYIRKYNGKDKGTSPVHVSDSTLVLYHVPGMEAGKQENYVPSFKGRRIMYNPQYNFVSNPYAKAQNINLGSKLMLTSK